MFMKTAEWTDSEDGTSTDWASIPASDMKIDCDVDKGTVYKILVHAHMSRVQSDTANTNTEFRIRVGDQVIGQTNTGNTYSWAYRAVELHGCVTEYAASHDEFHVQVQYRTQRGKVFFPDDASGAQNRRLTVQWEPV